MIIRIRTVYDDRLWIESEDPARAQGRKLILVRDRSGARRYSSAAPTSCDSEVGTHPIVEPA